MNTEVEKPNASLTAKEVYDIVSELDNKINEVSELKDKARKQGDEVTYIAFLNKEIAYMECRSLIFGKL